MDQYNLRKFVCSVHGVKCSSATRYKKCKCTDCKDYKRLSRAITPETIEKNKARCRKYRENNKKKIIEQDRLRNIEIFKKSHKYCKVCKKEIDHSQRTNGKTTCSECNKELFIKRSRSGYIKRRNTFNIFKTSFGCVICGYKKYSGALDFHHIDPKQKEIRLSGRHTASFSKKIKDELDKCVLVCKNCHYELHDVMRKDLKEYEKIIEKLIIPKYRNGDVNA